MASGHVRKRGEKWAAVVDVGRDETGRRRQKWVSGFKTKAEAEAAAAELLLKVRRGDLLAPDMTPVREYVAAWLDTRVDQLAPLTVTQYRSVWRNHISPDPLGGIPLGALRRSHLRAWDAVLRGKGLSRATINTCRAVLGRALADAAADDLIASSPLDKTSRASGGDRRERRITAWTSSELRALLDAASGDRLEALWRVAVATGLRRGELLGLRWLDFSPESRTLDVVQQVVPTRGGLSITDLKTKGSRRKVTIDDATVDALEEHRARQIAERDAAGDAYTADRDLIFADPLGRPIRPPALSAAFERHRAAAGIRPGRLHDVRHSHASHLLTSGIPVHVVSARLGHSSPTITLSVYAHVLSGSDATAADVVAAILG